MFPNRDAYEFADEYDNRPDELEYMSLEDYNDMRCEQEYGLTDEDMDSGDED